MKIIPSILCLTLSAFVTASLATTSVSKLNLNKATVVQLTRLKGIGKIKATRIVSYRKEHGLYHSINDLLAVKGINQHVIAKIKPDQLSFS